MSLAIIGPRRSFGSFLDPIALTMKIVWLIRVDVLDAISVALVIVVLALIIAAISTHKEKDGRNYNGTKFSV